MFIKVIKVFSFAFFLLNKMIRRLKMYFIKPLFKKIGSKVIFDPNDSFSYNTITLGSHIFVGKGATFRGEIQIKDKVMFGPNVTIMGGDHDISQIGRYMIDIKEHEKTNKKPRPIIIEMDSWIGANAILLKGVKIGKGSVVGAGSLVTKDVEPYSIVFGVPAKHFKYRFTKEEIDLHEKQIFKN